MAQYQLVLRVGPSPGKVYPLMKNEITIGRDINNEIVINDAEVSRKHCRLKAYGEGYLIEDLGSTNGTWVNEQRITGQHQLRSGEMLRLGDNISLTFEMVGYDADATVASASSPGAGEPPPTLQQEPPPRQQRPQAPPQQPPRQSEQQYAGRVPAPSEPPKILGMSRTLFIVVAALLVIALCLIVFLIYVDANCLWCEITWDLLPGCPYTAPCP